MKIQVNADIKMEIPEGMNEEKAIELIYEVMFNCLCNNADRLIDFEIYKFELVEDYTKTKPIVNNIHDKVFVCPKCENKTLYPINGNEDITGIGYHELCICEECGAELYTEPQYDYTVQFVEITEE